MTCPPGTTLEQAKELLHRHRIEKLLVVDKEGDLKGLITVKDIQKQIKYPNAMQGLARAPARRRRPSGRRPTSRTARASSSPPRSTCSSSTPRTATARASCAGSPRSRRRSRRRPSSRATSRPPRGRATSSSRGADAVKIGIGPGPSARPGSSPGRASRRSTRSSRPSRAPASRGLARRRRRDQVLRRRHEGARGGSALRDDRQPLRGHGRGAGRDDPLPGPHVQGVPRDGLDRRDEGGLGRPLLPGRGRAAQDGPRGNRGDGPAQGPRLDAPRAAHGRRALGHGPLRRGDARRTS